MRDILRAVAAATVTATLGHGCAAGTAAAWAGQAVGALSVRVVVVAPGCTTGDGCAAPPAAISASNAAGSSGRAPVAVREERESDRIVRTVIY